MVLASKAVARPAGLRNPSGHLPLRILNSLVEAPSILMAGAVRVLCEPLTKRVLTGAIILDIPLQWGTHVAMRQGTAAALGAMDGFDVSVTTLALIGLYIGWLFTERAKSRRLRIVWNWPIATYTATVVISLFVSANLQLSLFQVCLMLEMLLLYLYFAANITSREEIVALLRLLMWGGIIEGGYVLILAVTGHEFALIRAIGIKSVIYHPVLPGEIARYGGTVGSPNDAAAYLAVVIVLAFAARYLMLDRKLRRLATPVLILGVGALVFTYSRGGWIELTLSAAILIAATWLKGGITPRRAFACGALLFLIVAALYIPNPISDRFTANDNGSAYSRIPLMHLAENMIKANPVLGVGANNFAAVMGGYEGPEFRHAWIYTVHNQFLLVWSETGIVGLIAFLWIYGNLILRGWRLWRTGDALFAPLGLTIVAALCGFMSHMLVDQFSGRPMIQMVWMFAALIAACEVIRGNETAGRATAQVDKSHAELVAA